jgi:hypothetical protein
MQNLPQDVRYALRTLRASPGSTIGIVASLAVGIGANTAIFGVVNSVLLKPLPYPEPERPAVQWLRSPGIRRMDVFVPLPLGADAMSRRATRLQREPGVGHARNRRGSARS